MEAAQSSLRKQKDLMDKFETFSAKADEALNAIYEEFLTDPNYF